ncbi:MAG: glutamate--tRNA ligase [Planctomycetota bacterium]|jgi:glutamyl-tRNA synthetase
MSNEQVRVRFAPSPTGYLHIGGARTVLFNWLVARKAGGTFVLRIEDTDRTRHVEDSVGKILEDLRWLGLLWDEGPEVGGGFGPYFQSERLETYQQHIQRLLESGDAYYAFETPQELETMRQEAQAAKRNIYYRRPDPLPTVADGEAARAAGKPCVVRFKMPGTDITVNDEILGEVTLAADQLEDFVIQKGDGFPTYHFACVVDDALMKITHVLRGQEHLMNTPKHVAMQRALGLPTPRYGHMPVIFNMDGSKMSKRDKEKAIKRGEVPPEIDVHDFRASGYLPEAVLNFIALLGWSSGDDRERFTLEELTEAFSIDRVGKTNARFDRVKLLSFNTDWAATANGDRLFAAFRDFLDVSGVDGTSITDVVYQPTAGVPTDDDWRWMLDACAGFRTFPDVIRKSRFLLTPTDCIEFDPKAVKKVLAKNDGAGYDMLACLHDRLAQLEDWSAPAIESTLASIVEEKATKLGNVAQPIRVAITGSTVSPSIHESLARLGKSLSVERLERCMLQREPAG